MKRRGAEGAPERVLAVVSAKINLYLRIVDAGSSGYHLIETLYHSIDLRDEVFVKRNAGGVRLEVEPESHQGVPEGEENLAYQAAERFLHEAHTSRGVDIVLRKHIPIGAGLGGGSADAAAVLRGINLLYGSLIPEVDIYRMAGELGSDVPFLLYGGASIAWGRGDRLIPLQALSSLHVGICYPRFQVSSRRAYGMIDRGGAVRYPGAALLAFDELGREDWILSHLCNDFEEVLFSEHPELREIKEALLVSGAAGALLSGSGSSVFGLFRSEKRMQEALAKISSEYPVDTFECRLVSQGMIIEIPVAD